MKTIVITRRWVQVVTYRSSRWMFTYDYAFNAGRPPAVQTEYGTGLADLRRVLRRKYPDHSIVEAWKD
jgi:hypothetical protein